MGECGLYLGQRKLGCLAWEPAGRQQRLLASCPSEMGLIYRVVLQTDQGLRHLGVMLPENDRFLLRREIPAGEAPVRAFIDRTLPGEAHLPGLPLALSAFSPVEEDEIANAAGALQSACWMDMEYFLFPLRLGTPCALASFLCITTLVEAEGESYGVFCRKGEDFLPLPQPETDTLRGGNVVC